MQGASRHLYRRMKCKGCAEFEEGWVLFLQIFYAILCREVKSSIPGKYEEKNFQPFFL